MGMVNYGERNTWEMLPLMHFLLLACFNYVDLMQCPINTKNCTINYPNINKINHIYQQVLFQYKMKIQIKK
jgi:hypothetical protein